MTKKMHLHRYLKSHYLSYYQAYFDNKIFAQMLISFVLSSIYFLKNEPGIGTIIIGILLFMVFMIIARFVVIYFGVHNVTYDIIKDLEAQQQELDDSIFSLNNELKTFEYVSIREKRGALLDHMRFNADHQFGTLDEIADYTDAEINKKIDEFVVFQEKQKKEMIVLRKTLEGKVKEIRNLMGIQNRFT